MAEKFMWFVGILGFLGLNVAFVVIFKLLRWDLTAWVIPCAYLGFLFGVAHKEVQLASKQKKHPPVRNPFEENHVDT